MLTFCCDGGSFTGEKALELSSTQGILTSKAKLDLVQLRTFKGFLTNTAPTNIDKQVYQI